MFIVKNCWGDPRARWGVHCQALIFPSACKYLSRQRPLGAEISSSEKVDLGFGVVSGPKFSGLLSPNAGRIAVDQVFPMLDISIRSPSKFEFEVVRSRPKFCTFMAPNFFWGRALKFWDLIYQIREPSDNVARFRGDQLTDLGDPVAKQKEKKHQQ